ncbi:hypothetical protein J7S50_12815 [Providencia rettgeri]|uniref:phage tail fiber protein n=1 Tax=Providencia rettgeri TaxID=587 RepID=UPI001B39A00F|nr:hypothetical protein [Providencia rettgeri]MBQ0210082.1 hypothetical protein [Providencia rettgeri]
MYNIGTVTTTANSPKITGTGTRWKDNTTLVSVGQVVLIENGSNLLINSIYSIESNTALTLAFPVSAKLTNAKYIILTTMIDSISDGVNKATAIAIASEVYTDILNQWMTVQGTIDVELPTGQKIKLRTVAEMDKQLDGKFDKAGGDLTGALTTKGAITSDGNVITSKNANGNVAQLNTSDSIGPKIRTMGNGSGWLDHFLPKKSGELMHIGDYGWGANSSLVPEISMTEEQATNWLKAGDTRSQIYRNPSDDTMYASKWSTNAYFKSAGTFLNISMSYSTGAITVVSGNNALMKVAKVYSDLNTTKDSNGNLKAASPIVKVFADHIENNDESEGVTLKKLHTGIYQLHGVLGLHSDASWGGINGGITIPCGINQLPLVYALYDVLEKGEQHPFDGRIVEPDEDGDIVLYTTYRKHGLPQNIQYERFKLYPEFLKEVDGEKVELTPGEPCDIPVGHWVDVRVNMPSDSIYNQKQAEAERLAKIEAERLAQEEAKRAAEEAERAEQEAAERKQYGLDDSSVLL